jgi:hypothetical protein
VKIIFLITALILLVSVQYFAINERRVQREKQTSRYLATQPIEDLMQEMTKRMAKNIPVDQRQKFKDFMINNVDIVLLKDRMKILMQKRFTDDELNALADFYGSSAGKSAVKKLNVFRIELIPALQAEFTKSYAKANREQ